ncbi:MAG TPA: TSUP family transporter [Gaiellaceae bacterium]|nr:TSUP family transporter [Gaiellaceae bacterium]
MELALAFVASFVAGYLGSAIGLVLGTLRLPAILLLSGDAAAGAGTNVAISAASAAGGSVRHAREGRVDRRVVAWMLPPSVAGAVVGALLTDVVGFALGFVAFLTHAVLGQVECDILAAGVAGALPGGWLGARLTGHISENTIRLARSRPARDRACLRGGGAPRLAAALP